MKTNNSRKSILPNRKKVIILLIIIISIVFISLASIYFLNQNHSQQSDNLPDNIDMIVTKLSYDIWIIRIDNITGGDVLQDEFSAKLYNKSGGPDIVRWDAPVKFENEIANASFVGLYNTSSWMFDNGDGKKGKSDYFILHEYQIYYSLTGYKFCIFDGYNQWCVEML